MIILNILFFLVCTFSVLANSYDKRYRREAEIPEPLLFDLVRRINSDKGELEVNSLFTQTRGDKFDEVYIAPEIEYAFADGKAIEFELPTADGKIKTFKSAAQFRLPAWIGDLTGTQIIHEKINNESINETTVLLLSGKRLDNKWSLFSMVGNKFVYGSAEKIKNSRMNELPILNLNFFYDYAELFDLGIEMNLKGIGRSFQKVTLMPQLHALMSHDFKVQFGFGASYDGYTVAPITAFRLIKEFNYGP